MKVLVTGANGYLGTGIVKNLCDKGFRVIASYRSNQDRVDPRASTKICDIFKINNPYQYFEEPDVVLHLAWRDGFIHNALSHIEDLPYHYNFIKKIIDGGCKHIAIMGSMHEVGFYEGSIKEYTPTNPETLYGISKDALCKSVKILCKDNNVIFQWLRGYYIVGNAEHGSSIFSKITAAENKGQDKFPFTMGINQYDFLDYEEFVSQVVAVIKQNKINGIINICSGQPEKLSDRVERFLRENNYKIKLEYGKFPDRPYDSKAVWGDNRKIIKILNHDKNW